MTNTKTETEAETQTQPQTEVNAELLKLIAKYCQYERKSYSMYFPLILKALDLFEDGMEQKEIVAQFRNAFAKVSKCEWKEYERNPEYVTFRSITYKIVNIAKCGRKWYDEHQKQGLGFYAMYEQCKAIEDDKPQPKKESKTKTKNPGLSNPETEVQVDPVADKQWFAKCRLIAKEEPHHFIKMISDLIDKGLLPDTILDLVKVYLNGE